MPECTCADPTAVSNAINQQSSNISSSVNAHGQTLDQTLYGQTLRAVLQEATPVLPVQDRPATAL